MPIFIDISEDKFLMELWDAAEAQGKINASVKETAHTIGTIRRLLDSNKLSQQEISDILRVPLGLVYDVEAGLMSKNVGIKNKTSIEEYPIVPIRKKKSKQIKSKFEYLTVDTLIDSWK
jgi:predicted XRE-type DNA-binding protein